MKPATGETRVRSSRLTGAVAGTIHGPAALCLAVAAFVLTLLVSGGADARSGLKADVPEQCYRCHKELKKGLSDAYVHAPFAQGRCVACHNPHVSDKRGLLKEDTESVCLGCHKKIRRLIRQSNLHGALKKGTCTDCHDPHSGNNKYLLVSEEKEICWNCHGNLKEQLGKRQVHAVFKAGKCSSCHDAHASSEKEQLLSAPSRLCRSCHEPRCRADGVPIARLTRGMDCTECHSGHASDAAGLLGPYGHESFLGKDCKECHGPVASGRRMSPKVKGEALCLGCHKGAAAPPGGLDPHGAGRDNACTLCHSPHASKKKNLTVDESGVCLGCHEKTEKRTALMERTLKSIRCAPVKERRCFECHVPGHSDQPLYFRTDEIETCSKCHESQHEITHPVGEGVIDPRNGRKVTCISCHSMHAAKADFMLSFDRKRQLCIQCHKMP